MIKTGSACKCGGKIYETDVNKISKEVDSHEEMCYLIDDGIKEIEFEN